MIKELCCPKRCYGSSMQGFAVKYYLCHNQSVEISRTNHKTPTLQDERHDRHFATQFLSKPDGVVHGRLHGTAV
ncbi:hypothetical protein NXY07_12865 [Phocaeicola dorei]|nr:hypothetical protein [Phocaeicola dorei]